MSQKRSQRNPIHRSDPVLRWTRQAARMLRVLRVEGFPISQVLTNGHIERELKFLLAAAAERPRQGRSHACLLEKNAYGVPFDLIAYSRRNGPACTSIPTLWMETKSSFADKCLSATAQTKRVLKQLAKYRQKILRANTSVLRRCYVVHFVVSRPSEESYPPKVRQRFKANRKVAIWADDLAEAYKAAVEAAPSRFKLQGQHVEDLSRHHRHRRVAPPPRTEVLILKLRVLPRRRRRI